MTIDPGHFGAEVSEKCVAECPMLGDFCQGRNLDGVIDVVEETRVKNELGRGNKGPTASNMASAVLI